jgi:hypothetical protein
MRDGRVIADVARALSPSPHWHCADVFANVMLVVPLLHWHCCRHRTGTVTFNALAHRCYRCCCVCVFATVVLLSLPLHGPNVVVMGGCCWHCTDAVALASTPSHGRHRQRCTSTVAIILLASYWHFFQHCRHGWRHCRPCTGVVTVALALTPSLGIIANVIHASLPSLPPSKTGLTPCLMWVRWLCVLPCYPRLAWLVDLVKGDLRVGVTLCSKVAFLAASLFFGELAKVALAQSPSSALVAFLAQLHSSAKLPSSAKLSCWEKSPSWPKSPSSTKLPSLATSPSWQPYRPWQTRSPRRTRLPWHRHCPWQSHPLCQVGFLGKLASLSRGGNRSKTALCPLTQVSPLVEAPTSLKTLSLGKSNFVLKRSFAMTLHPWQNHCHWWRRG